MDQHRVKTSRFPKWFLFLRNSIGLEVVNLSLCLWFLAPLMVSYLNPEDLIFRLGDLIGLALLLSILTTAVLSSLCLLHGSLRDGIRAVASGIAAYVFLALVFFPVQTGFLTGSNSGPAHGNWSIILRVLAVIGFTLVFLIKRDLRKTATQTLFLLSIISVVGLSVGVSVQKSGDSGSSDPVEGFFELSPKRNVIFLSFDSLQNDVVEDVLKNNPALAQALDGFVFFRDSVASAPNTNFSIDALLAGRLPEPGEETGEFLQAVGEESWVSQLKNRGYRTVLYNISKETFGVLVGDRDYQRGDIVLGEVESRWEAQQALTYSTMRYWPGTGLASSLNGLTRAFVTRESEVSMMMMDTNALGFPLDLLEFNAFVDGLRIDPDLESTVHYHHYLFTHEPLNFDKDGTFRLSDSVRQSIEEARNEVEFALTRMSRFIERMKELRVYDDALVVFVGDHGYEANINMGVRDIDGVRYSGSLPIGGGWCVARYSGMVMVKPPGGSGPLVISDAPIHQIDLGDLAVRYAAMDTDQWDFRSFTDGLKQGREREILLFRGTGGDEKNKHRDVRLFERFPFTGTVHRELPRALAEYLGLGSAIAGGSLQVNGTVDFSKNGNSAEFCTSGWSIQENAFRWTNDWTAGFTATIKEAASYSHLRLRARMAPYLGSGALEAQGVTVVVNGSEVEVWNVVRPGWYDAMIPRSVLDGEIVSIVFEIESPLRPNAVTDSQDNRLLGVAMYELALDGPGSAVNGQIARYDLSSGDVLRVGETIDFSKEGNSAGYCTGGWSSQEDGFRWTDDWKAGIVARIDGEEFDDRLRLRARVMPFLGFGAMESQAVSVLVNGTEAGAWNLTAPGWYEVDVAADVLTDDTLMIDFVIGNPGRPSDFEDSNDGRLLGIALYELRLETASP